MNCSGASLPNPDLKWFDRQVPQPKSRPADPSGPALFWGAFRNDYS